MNIPNYKFSAQDLQDNPTLPTTNKNNTEDVELTFNLVSEVYILFQVKTLQQITQNQI